MIKTKKIPIKTRKMPQEGKKWVSELKREEMDQQRKMKVKYSFCQDAHKKSKLL